MKCLAVYHWQPKLQCQPIWQVGYKDFRPFTAFRLWRCIEGSSCASVFDSFSFGSWKLGSVDRLCGDDQNTNYKNTKIGRRLEAFLAFAIFCLCSIRDFEALPTF